eukprot:scaffold562723_cov14-Prasinocladus_malaysianus.AAC.1
MSSNILIESRDSIGSESVRITDNGTDTTEDRMSATTNHTENTEYDKYENSEQPEMKPKDEGFAGNSTLAS